jgi:hypothetical protein
MGFVSLAELAERLDAVHVALQKDNKKRRNLPGADQKNAREWWQAWLFATIYSRVFGLVDMFVDISVPLDSDHDAVLRWKQGSEYSFLKVQLKELPPGTLSPIGLFELLAEKIGEPRDTRGVVLAVMLGRDSPQPSTVEIPDHKFDGLWLFGISSRKPLRGFVRGQDLTGRRAESGDVSLI